MGTTDMVTALVSPVNKLLDIVSIFIGKLYEPKHIRKIADAKAHELNVIGKALRDNSDLPITYDKSAFTIDTTNCEELAKRAGNRLAVQEMVKQQNIEAVVDYAYSELDGQKSVDNLKPDNDWLLRFFSSVEDISNDDMQILWGRLLAGEIVKPHSFSMRTLGTLRNLTSVEAIEFAKACRISMKTLHDRYIFNDMNTLKEHGLTFADMLNLQDYGLLNADTSLSLINEIAPMDKVFYSHKNRIILVSNQNDKPMNISIRSFKMTKAAFELAQIVSPDESEQDVIINAKYIKRLVPSCIVSVHDIIGIDDSSLEYQDEGIIIQ